jgi:hypothetical protein
MNRTERRSYMHTSKTAVLVGVVLTLLLPATAVRADTITVSVNSLGGLWGAIQQANERPSGTHTIIYLEGKPYVLKQPLPVITGSITIQGINPGLTIISGSCTTGKTPLPVDSSFDSHSTYEECDPTKIKEFPIFSVESGGYLRLDWVTIRDAQWAGGALYNKGTLEVLRSTIAHNHAHFSGGGIYNDGGYVYIQDSTIRQNFAHQGSGGGIYNATNGVVDIRYSTLNHNRGNCAGGIYNGTGGQDGGWLSILNSTISNNKATQPSECGARLEWRAES